MDEKFLQNSRLVAGVHMTETPATLVYASVVSIVSVRITLTIEALNVLDILSCDIENDYLTADCLEKDLDSF